MLEVARRRLPDVEFIHGDLERLPVPDTSIDLVVCALAMTHLAELGPAFREFARVLRPQAATADRRHRPGAPKPRVRPTSVRQR